jgi:hypothetical protein
VLSAAAFEAWSAAASGAFSVTAFGTSIAIATGASFTTSGASFTTASGTTGADCGSQDGHSFSLGGISRPHSGQIQWNMIQFTRNLFFIRSGNYPTRIT